MAEVQFLAYASYSNGDIVNVTTSSLWVTGTITDVAEWVNPYGLATTIPLVPPTGGFAGTYVTGGFLNAFASFGQGLTSPSGPDLTNVGYVSEFWEVTTPQGGNVQLVLRGDTDLFWPSSSIDPFGLDTRMWLYDQNGLCIVYNDDVNVQQGNALPQGSPAFQGYWSWMSTTLAPNTTYFIEVSSLYTGYYFNYHLQFVPDIGVTATLQETLPLPFVQASPLITSISPSASLYTTGVPVVIVGSGFQNGLTVELSNSNYIRYPTINNVSPTQIDMTVVADYPAAAQVFDVKVVNPDLQQFVLSGAFEHVAPPMLFSYESAGFTGEFSHYYGLFGRGDTIIISGSYPRSIVSASFNSSTTAPVPTDPVWFAIDGQSTDNRGFMYVTATIPSNYSPANGVDSYTHTLHLMDSAGLTARSYATSFAVTDEFFGLAYGPNATGSNSGRIKLTASLAEAPAGWYTSSYGRSPADQIPPTLPVRVLPKYFDTTGSIYNSDLLFYHNPNMVNSIIGGFYSRVTNYTGSAGCGYGSNIDMGSGWAANNGTGSNWPDVSHTKLSYQTYITVAATSSGLFYKHPGYNEVWNVAPNFGSGIILSIYCLAKG